MLFPVLFLIFLICFSDLSSTYFILDLVTFAVIFDLFSFEADFLDEVNILDLLGELVSLYTLVDKFASLFELGDNELFCLLLLIVYFLLIIYFYYSYCSHFLLFLKNYFYTLILLLS